MSPDLQPASDPSSGYTGIQPLVLAQELKQGIEEHLRTSYTSSTPGFEHLIEDFITAPDSLFKGPYLALDLPFTTSERNTEFFASLPLGHRPYMHQERAFERLQGDEPRSTLIATGTGSGKTECFLLPILDWCRRHAGEPGIKAIIIYPMNALAEDQARRLADWIWRNPHLRNKVRAGMYADAEPGNATRRMQPDSVIRNREAMHRNPPDILLTNYKMLDNLLLRPDRQGLWTGNAPDTLRYLVVDELHTFDGAQGTDLACLIRRLKQRLHILPHSLCCVGTSATLGDRDDAVPIIDYAEDLFAEPFTDDAVVMEDRLDMAQFLEQVQGTVCHERLPDQETVRHLADPACIRDPETRIQHLYAAWFGEEAPDDVNRDTWRIHLGEQLRGHAFLSSVLESLEAGIQTLDAVARGIRHHIRHAGLHAWSQRDVEDLVSGFITLLAFAQRRADPEDPACLPFLTVRIHFWIRELRRMVVSLPASGTAQTEALARARLLHSDDLPLPHEEAVLPVVHCRECRSMAWIALEKLQGNGFEQSLDSIYSAYFARQPSQRLVYLLNCPPAAGVVSGAQHIKGYVCRQCLHWHIQSQEDEEQTLDMPCPDCGSQQWTRIWRSAPKWLHDTGQRRETRPRCAYCGTGTGIGIFGLSATSLASSLVSMLFASKANGDPKLLAFADSVQDAAHKAGFIEARSFRTILRQAVAHWLVQQDSPVSLDHLHASLPQGIRQAHVDAAEFIGTMTPADLMWYSDIQDLFEAELGEPASPDAAPDTGVPIPKEEDQKAVGQRLAWEAFSELTFRSQFGRTLENTGCLSLALEPDVLTAIARDLETETGEQLGTLFAGVDERQYLHFLLGILYRMLHDGAVRIEPDGIDPIGSLARENARWFAVLKSRRVRHIYPNYSRTARKPLLPSLQGRDGFAALTDAGSSARWYPLWVRKCLQGGGALQGDMLADFYTLVFRYLDQHELASRLEGAKGRAAWALQPARVQVSLEAERLECSHCHRDTHVHPAQSSLWAGMPCLNAGCRGTLQTVSRHASTASVLRAQLLHGHLRRVNARDHTSMLEPARRRRIERQFIQGRHAWYPNVLSTTPTLELGVDIGALSSVLLYSMPPSPANYVQRLGRAGRRDGNALGLAIANSQPHDLFFWAEPAEMIQGAVAPPGLYLEAHAILRRQFCAFALERLITDTDWHRSFGRVRTALEALRKQDTGAFPLVWIEFVEQRGESLLADFRQMFADLPNAQFDLLAACLHGTEEHASFRATVQDCLAHIEEENGHLRQRAAQLTRQIRELGKVIPAPKDQETQIRRLERERFAYRRIVNETNRKDVLELLTDHGILPNYAFPAEGIRLRSVIVSRDGEGEGWHEKPYDYMRAASAGLSELAPGSRFYAEGHRVRINGVDLKISDLESWRFCPACPHMELDAGTPAAACPRCQSPQWRDVGQKHRMVRLKQVHAHTMARSARISDDQETRSTTWHDRHIFPDFDPRTARGSRVLSLQPQTLGIEFLPHVEFRDVNFGRRGHRTEQENIIVAGQPVGAESFLLCTECGHALSPEMDNWQDEHARYCPVRRLEDDTEYRTRAFLYSSFPSEAVRLRLPIYNGNEAEMQLESFRAALHLGMRLRFQGKVEHLQTLAMTQAEAQNFNSYWLFLYDSVPGGTGYLEQLTSPDVFEAVLRLALQAMLECDCNQAPEEGRDPEAGPARDGCYRCLYRYRNRMRRMQISRQTAIQMIRRILAAWPTLQETDSLESAMDTVQLEESVLELRFVDWLDARIRQDRGRLTKISLDSGHYGYRLELAGMTWEMQPQVHLGSGDSVREDVRPDFLLRHTRGSGTLSRPVAIFMDGWAYHRNNVARDIQQRTAIRDSGRHWLWSLTWADVTENSTQGAPDASFWHPFRTLDPTSLPAKEPDIQALLRAVKQGNAAELLFQYLQKPDPDLWQSVAGQLSLPILRRHIPIEPLLKRLDRMHPDASEVYTESMSVRSYFGLIEHEDSLLAMGAEKKDLGPILCTDGLRPFLYLHLEQGVPDRCSWAGSLYLFNLLQFLPRTIWTCTDTADLISAPAQVLAVQPHDNGWHEAREFMDANLQDMAATLFAAGAPSPEVCWETMHEGVVAGAMELAWPRQQVGILMEPLPDRLHRKLQADGWQLFTDEVAVARHEDVQVALQGRKAT